MRQLLRRGLRRLAAAPFLAPLVRHARIRAATGPGRRVIEILGLARFFPDRAEVFKQIYATNAWGQDGQSRFFSGVGSRGDAAAGYVEEMAALLARHEAEVVEPLTVVDIGCGDFEIGRALVERLPGIHYVGCDIVAPLIEHHQAQHSGGRVSFRRLDIVAEAPPSGHVCLVRQVFQHLSNEEIRQALRNLSGFPVIYVTEGQPEFPSGPLNPDKEPGSTVRFDWRTGRGRGVELGAPPFSLRVEKVFQRFVPPHEVAVTFRVYLDASPAAGGAASAAHEPTAPAVGERSSSGEARHPGRVSSMRLVHGGEKVGHGSGGAMPLRAE